MSLFRRFAENRAGNFAIMASAVVVPLVMVAGIALDLSTISRTRAELQSAMDSAVLAVAREGKEVDDQQAREIAMMFVANNYHLKFTDLDITREGSAVQVHANTRATMAFGALFGYQDWEVTASSSADIAYASYEIALVLDTTGSMAGGKLTAMKDAVDGMIESMSAQMKDKDRLKFSLVPFASFVNVGPEHGPKFDKDGKHIAGTGASWLDLEGDSPIPQTELGTGASRFQLYANVGKQWPGCVETRYGGDLDVSDAEPSKYDPETLYVPAFGIDEPDSGEFVNSYIAAAVDPHDKSKKAKKIKWAKYGVNTNANGEPLLGGLLSDVTGLLGLGSDDDDDDDDDEDGGKKAKPAKVKIDDSPSSYQGFAKGPDFGCGTQPITALTNDYTTLRNRVKSLNANGNTNIMEGVAWGTRVLSKGEPFSQGADKEELGIEKIMVVLTDGSNTMPHSNTSLGSHYSSFGFLADGRLGFSAGSSASTNSAMNDRTLAACEHAKKDGVTLYTIRLEEPDVKTGNMLEQCATSVDHYFDAPSRSQLDDVFKTIRDRVVRLRLAS